MESKLIRSLQKYGDIQVVKAGYVLTILITGNGLSKATTVVAVQTKVSEIVKDKYPVIEVMKNEESFFLIVLKPKTT